jgi:hypothetical protein
MDIFMLKRKEEGKKREKRGKKKRIQDLLEVGLSFTLLSTSLSMRPGIAKARSSLFFFFPFPSSVLCWMQCLSWLSTIDQWY